MKRGRTFLFVLLLAVVLAIFSSSVVNAGWFDKEKIPIPTVLKDVYVYDEDNIIDDEIESKINTLLIELEEKTTAEVAVVTVKSLLDMEIEDYSYELANTLGIGKKEEDNGVLLLISKSDTRVRLEIGEGLEGCLNDSKCGRILDNYFVPYREKSEYSTGTYETIKAVVSVIAKEYDVTIGEVDSSIAEEIEKQDELTSGDIWFIIIIIILILFVGFIIGVPDSGSTYRGGGFSSGGGGFSGGSFGGGSFGGGGASR